MISSLEERNERVEKNLGLVHSCAGKFRGRGVEYDDLFQAGCVGLVKAADRFDESLGFSFSTYAVPVILGEIKKIFRDGGTVKVGRTMKEKARRAMKEREKLSAELGREPSVSELAGRIGTDTSTAAVLLNVSLPALSLTPGDGEGREEIAVPVPSPEEELSDKMAVRQLLTLLNERDRRLLELRYFSGLTQQKTAEALEMTQVQVSRREKALLLQLRKMLS